MQPQFPAALVTLFVNFLKVAVILSLTGDCGVVVVVYCYSDVIRFTYQSLSGFIRYVLFVHLAVMTARNNLRFEQRSVFTLNEECVPSVHTFIVLY